MNDEIKKLRDELAMQHEFGERCSNDSSNYFSASNSFSKGFSQGHATAMKDVGELKQIIEDCIEGFEGHFGPEEFKDSPLYKNVISKYISRFTQTQTEKIEGE